MTQTLAAPSFLNEEQLEAFRRDGFIIVRGLLSQSEIDEICDTFMEQNKNGPVAGLSEVSRNKVDGTRGGYDPNDPLSFYPRMMHPHKHPDKAVGPLAKKYMLDSRIEAVLTELMGERPYAAQSMFYFKPPGARGQDFHQDNFYLKVKPGNCMAAWVAIDHCDEGNGGMMCVPDTGAYPIQCPDKSDPKLYFTTEHVDIPEGKHAILPIMKPGDVLFFNGSTIHGSGPNTSKDRFRRALICHYLPQSTTEMSQYYEVFDFQGNKMTHVKPNPDGGPCGTPNLGVTVPH
jgi:ectoine hydroxylase-related dioxygenase (phytanoyl-CoA dioxygenase family)